MCDKCCCAYLSPPWWVTWQGNIPAAPAATANNNQGFGGVFGGFNTTGANQVQQPAPVQNNNNNGIGNVLGGIINPVGGLLGLL
jgi:hypothetical protein